MTMCSTGLYTGHPSDSKSRLIRTYYPEHPMQLSFWGKSRVGLGGMENKVTMSNNSKTHCTVYTCFSSSLQ